MRQPAPYGRRKLSGSAALSVLGDGWTKITPRPGSKAPFDGAGPLPRRCALAAVVHVQRHSERLP